MQSFSPPTIFILSFFFFFVVTLSAEEEDLCHRDDEAGLLAFKAGITSDPSGMLSSWKPRTMCCEWNGIECTYDRVTKLKLIGDPNSTLSGTISPSLSKLQALEQLIITNHPNITGYFPTFLTNLPNLIYMYLDYNGLSGSIPPNIAKMTQLQAFGVEGNRFSGPIPRSIGSLTDLIELKLGENLLTGTIPDSIRHLTNLSLLTLNSNQLTGAIPDIFSDLYFLETIKFSHNKFTGIIPNSLSASSEFLDTVVMENNALSGKIPDFLGHCISLFHLDLSDNQFSGTVPESFSNLGNISFLDFSHNNLVDPFPVLKAKNLFTLDLSYNQFRFGIIPNWVISNEKSTLKLKKCGLNFNLDDWNQTDMGFYNDIDLSENEITGNPLKLLNKTDYLEYFNASGNKLKFDLEMIRFSPRLEDLDLSRNLVYGKVPKIVSGLRNFNVSQNHLCGQLPYTKFPSSAFSGNDCLCGSPLLPCKS